MVGGRRPSVEDDLRWKMTYVGRRPLVEDDLWWKTTFGGRRLSVEDDLRWKMTFGERWSSVEDNLWWKTIFGWRWPSGEDDLRWKMTFGGRRASVEIDLRGKTTFGGRRPLVEDDLWCLGVIKAWPWPLFPPQPLQFTVVHGGLHKGKKTCGVPDDLLIKVLNEILLELTNPIAAIYRPYLLTAGLQLGKKAFNLPIKKKHLYHNLKTLD